MSNSEFNKYLQRLEESKNRIVASPSLSAKFVREVRSNMPKEEKDIRKAK